MKKKTKLFKHFITLLNCMALSVPLLVLGITYLSDISARYFSSLSVSHSQTNGNFEDDLSYSFDKNTLPSINDYLFKTMDNVGYLDYDLNGYRVTEYQTNDITDVEDFILGNVYTLNYQNPYNEIFWGDLYINGATLNIDCLAYNINLYSSQDLALDEIFLNFIYNSNSYLLLTINWDFDEVYIFYFANPNDNYFCLYAQITSPSYFVFIADENFINSINNINDYLTLENRELFYGFFSSADLSLIAPQFEKVEGVDNLQEYQELIEGKSYNQIITNDVNTNMLVNFDFGKIFFNENMINQNGNIAPYLFINYMVNYFINISLFLFIPEFIICFFYMLRTMTYKLVDKEV